MTTATMPPISTGPDPALLDELYRAEGKAEIINGKVVHFMATGRAPV